MTNQQVTIRKGNPIVLGARTADEVLVSKAGSVVYRGHYCRQRGLYYGCEGGAGMSRARFVAAMQARFA